MKIAFASDHRGFELKKYLINTLKDNFDIIDLGTDSTDSVDFPLFGISLGEKIVNHEADLGIAICGTGIGISIACNKVKGVMCAKISSIEEAKLAKLHNQANVLAFSGDIRPDLARKMILSFIDEAPLSDDKYLRRINQIKDYDNER